MTTTTKSTTVGGTKYVIRLSNPRRFIPGVGVIDIESKRVGSTDIITNASVDVSPPSGVVTQEIGSPRSGVFSTDQVYYPASMGSVNISWVGEYGATPSNVRFTIEGFNDPSPSVCDYTDGSGVPKQTVNGVEFETVIDTLATTSVLSINQLDNLFTARDQRVPLSQCVGSDSGGTTPVGGGNQQPQGISPTTIGLGVLGLGAVAVVLSQRD